MKLLITWTFLFLLIFFSFSLLAADTNTVSSTVVTNNTPPTANSPSVVVNNSDVCKTAVAGAVQTQILGISSGITVTDENCERIKLSRSLYSMGMKVGAVTLLAQDYRVFDALWNAGTYPPINGLIGNDAKSEWLKPENKYLIPKGSFLLNKENEIVETKKGNDDFEKFLFYGMALYIGFPILF
tara:strand:- start:129 stop:680 length:552 start_codon:yes stop_codon:yes gene_type:complete